MKIDRSNEVRTEFNLKNILWWMAHSYLIVAGLAGWRTKKWPSLWPILLFYLEFSFILFILFLIFSIRHSLKIGRSIGSDILLGIELIPFFVFISVSGLTCFIVGPISIIALICGKSVWPEYQKKIAEEKEKMKKEKGKLEIKLKEQQERNREK